MAQAVDMQMIATNVHKFARGRIGRTGFDSGDLSITEIPSMLARPAGDLLGIGASFGITETSVGEPLCRESGTT